jgi:hypothetical protein
MVSRSSSVHPTDSYANYLDVAAASRAVQPLLAFQFERFTLTHRDGSYAVHGARAQRIRGGEVGSFRA